MDRNAAINENDQTSSRQGPPGQDVRSGTEETLRFLRAKADELGATLPPLGRTPRRWPLPLQAPHGPVDPLGKTPWKFLRGVLHTCRVPILTQTFTLSVNMLCGVFMSVVVGRCVDAGMEHGLSVQVWRWIGVLAALVVVAGATAGLNQLAEIASWMRGALGSARTVAHRVASAGRGAKQEKPAGDIVTALLADSDHVGSLCVFVAEVISGLASFIVIAVLMLQISVPLGLAMTIGFPIAVAGVTALAKPIQRKLAVQREEQGRLTTISTDAVTGLRVLRGIGGEDYYNTRYREQSAKVREAAIRVAPDQALLAVMRSSVPMLFLAAVAGFGSMLVFKGAMTPGQLLTFAGLTSSLANPINIAAWAAQIATRAWVGIKKLAEFNALVSPVAKDACVSRADAAAVSEVIANAAEQTILDDGGPNAPAGTGVGSAELGNLPLTDQTSGVTIEPGKLTALVAPSPEVCAQLATRLARVDDAHEVLAGQTDLRTLQLDAVRQGITLLEADAQLFAGTLHAALRAKDAKDPLPRGVTELVYREHLEEAARSEGALFRADRVPDDDRLAQSMLVADAQDVLDSLSGGMAGRLAERGRNLSGGQRQRVALARAIYADSPVLIAVEPTSAVDSHTEERISERVARERHGRTTVVVTASPLWLEKCDEVVVLDDSGKQVARGTHGQLRSGSDKGSRLYQSIVARESGGEL